MYSLVIPVYRNEGSIPDLVGALRDMNKSLGGGLEAVFIVDGSPDRSYARLQELLPSAGLEARLCQLSRNFGSFAAVRAGLAQAAGPYFAVMAADLQEPPELALAFFRALETEPCDVVIGAREGRGDPWPVRLAARLFWGLYRKCVIPEMPPGGVDVFGCNQAFRDQLLRLEESHSSLVAQLFWLGFRRKEVPYRRLERRHGRSAWTLRKKTGYLMDSVFAFTDLPVRLLIGTGAAGLALTLLLGAVTLAARFSGWITVPGYAATMLTILFFGALNLFGLGLVGSYAWRAYENTKHRPPAIPMSVAIYRRPPP